MNAGRSAALLITPVLPEPGGSGRALRAWDWLCTLAREHEVHVLVTADRKTCPTPSGYPAAALWWLEDQVRPSPRWSRAAGLLCPALGLASPSFMLDWLHPEDPQRVTAALREHLADQVVARIVVFRLAQHPVALRFLRHWPSATAELDLDDLESATRLSVAGSLWRMRRHVQALRTALIALQYHIVERWAWAPYATLWLAAPGDVRKLHTRLAERVACRPNRFPPLPRLAPGEPGDRVRLLFVGSLDYPPNEEAVRFLLGLATELDAGRLAWHLTLVGRRPPDSLRRQVARYPGIELLDGADDLTRHYRNADVVLVPLFAGGGTKLKTLEALAHGRPLVSTGQGVRGLRLRAGVDYLAAETPGEFYQAIDRLARSPALRERLVEAGRGWFDEGFVGP